MKSRLDAVNDWEALARRARHKSTRLAKLAGVSLRQLERFFAQHRQCCPHAWLVETRLTHAIELLRQGRANKDVADAVGFQSPSCLCRFFQEHSGFAPSEFLKESAPIDDVLCMSGWQVNRTSRRAGFPQT